MMKKFVLVLALTLFFACCVSFSVFAAPASSATIVISDGSTSKSISVDRFVNNYPLQVNSPIYTYEPWSYSVPDSTFSFTPGKHYDFQFENIWSVVPQSGKGDSISFNVGIIVVPNVGTQTFPAMSGRLWDIKGLVGNMVYDVEIKQSYSVIFDIPNITTTSSNPVGTQMQYVCYTCVMPLPSDSSFSLGLKCKLNVYEWPSFPIFSLLLCVSDVPIQFSNFNTTTDSWAQVFEQFLTPEELKKQEQHAEQGNNAGQGAQDVINNDVMGGDYGGVAQAGFTTLVVPLLDNPLIATALPVGVVLILLLWGIHKGNS